MSEFEALHDEFMDLALREAEKAREKDEVPVGAVLVDGEGRVVACGHNQTISLADPTAHAEILALRAAAQAMSNYRLPGLTLYATIEPCIMCMGALVHARVARVVFGVRDPKWGGAGSLYDFSSDARLNHRLEVIAGVREAACRSLIQEFFREKRKSVASIDGLT